MTFLMTRKKRYGRDPKGLRQVEQTSWEEVRSTPIEIGRKSRVKKVLRKGPGGSTTKVSLNIEGDSVVRVHR